jgi:hypothetical protein
VADLRQSFSLDFNESYYFIAMRERCCSDTFGIYAEFWSGLLAGDDLGEFNYHVSSGAFAVFGPNRSLSFGRRGSNWVQPDVSTDA